MLDGSPVHSDEANVGNVENNNPAMVISSEDGVNTGSKPRQALLKKGGGKLRSATPLHHQKPPRNSPVICLSDHNNNTVAPSSANKAATQPGTELSAGTQTVLTLHHLKHGVKKEAAAGSCILTSVMSQAAFGQQSFISVGLGDDAALPCADLRNNQGQCQYMTWIFSNTMKKKVTFFKNGNFKNARSGRLSVTENCSLVIKKVTVEDGGVYTCRLSDKSRPRQGPGEQFVLSVITATTAAAEATTSAVATELATTTKTDPEDGVSYASISFTKKTNSKVQVQNQVEEDEAVMYSTVKVSSASTRASIDLSSLYAAINKRQK
ncbi:uncharacterized protein [Channa argus]|uniref:uncharacterized protein isoform X3 n=1 Tax=Channa argus TaxID=215402 RepID=UPI00351FE2DE